MGAQRGPGQEIQEYLESAEGAAIVTIYQGVGAIKSRTRPVLAGQTADGFVSHRES